MIDNIAGNLPETNGTTAARTAVESGKIPASGADTGSKEKERLDEEEKRRVNAELAKPDVSANALADIFVEYIHKRNIPKDEENLRLQAMKLAKSLISYKENYGIEGVTKLFAVMVDRPGSISLKYHLDPNGDGRISVREFFEAAARGKIDDVLRSLDLNHDGMVTKAEATKALQNAGLKLDGIRGGFDKSAAVLGVALAHAGVQFRPMMQSGHNDHHEHPCRPEYVAVVPPAPDSCEKAR